MPRHFPCFIALALAAAAAELPVRQVVLYKHGVGYFERAGQLAAGESARLDFKASEMNDVLKSLTVEEKGGGRITAIRYDAAEPFEQRQAGFPFRIVDGQALSAILDQLKGARVELTLGVDTVAGTIVTARVLPGDDKRTEREQLNLLLDSGDIRIFDLGAITSVRFADPKLQNQFREYLAALSGSRSKERRSLYIDSSDAKTRDIVVNYVIPSPVWKSSYRLIFDSGPQATLEGWAIVDNTTGEDWTKVQLALVSGRPISFISHLYEPRYVSRPTASLPEDQSQAPVVHSGAIEEATALKPMAGLPGGAVGGMLREAAAPAPRAKVDAANAADRFLRTGVASSVAQTAATRELGELFEYRIPTPVTVRKGESAMLPFLQQKLEARKLLIYSDQSRPNPLNSAEITNSTGKTLDGGPITVFESGAYGGEALMETLKAGDKRLISYGVDLGSRITTQFESRAEVTREVHMRRGVLTTRTAAEEIKVYTIRNVDRKAKTLIIEHPVRPGYRLVDQKPWETTASAYRFEVNLAPGATEKFPVREEREYESTYAVTNLTPDVLLAYTRNKALSDAARKQMERMADQKRLIAETDSQIRLAESEMDALAKDQERTRQNIESLNRVSGQQAQVQEYARRLAAQESRLAALRDRSADLQKKRDALQQELNLMIEKAEF